MNGVILHKEEPRYVHIVCVCPKEHHYGNNVVKYTCPVCDEIGDRHQVHHSDQRCPICGANFAWLDEMKG